MGAPFGKARGPDPTAIGSASFTATYPTVKRRSSEATPPWHLGVDQIVRGNFKTGSLSNGNPPRLEARIAFQVVGEHRVPGEPEIMGGIAWEVCRKSGEPGLKSPS